MWLVAAILLASALGCSLGLLLASWTAHRRSPAARVTAPERPMRDARETSPPTILGGSVEVPEPASLSAADPDDPPRLRSGIDPGRDEGEALLDRYRVLTENLAAAVVIRDADSKIAYCSPYTELLTGYALSEIYESEGDFFLGIIHEDDRELYGRALHYTKVGEPFEFRYRFYHKTGIEMWAETRTVPILDPDGMVVSSLSITLDATRSVRQQLQLEEKNRDLEDFAYMISHDLKAPLYTIKGMLSVIEEDHRDALQGGLRELLDHVSKAACRIEQLVGGVLEYSKLSSQESRNENVDLGGVFGDILQDFGRQIEAYGARLEIEGELPAVFGDRPKLYQIFGNLIGNAIKYRSGERPLLIKVRAAMGAGPRSVRIEIEDNGSGISPEKLPHIFRPFQRAHGDEIEGSGIGLASAKKLAEKLGGKIEVKSEPGAGSTFAVTLNAVQTKSRA